MGACCTEVWATLALTLGHGSTWLRPYYGPTYYGPTYYGRLLEGRVALALLEYLEPRPAPGALGAQGLDHTDQVAGEG